MPFRPSAPAIAIALALALIGCGRPDADTPPIDAVESQDGAAEGEAAPPSIDPEARAPAAQKARPGWRRVPILVPDDARASLLEQAAEAESRGHWYGENPLGALDLYLALAELEAPPEEALAGQKRVVATLEAAFAKALAEGREDDAEHLGDVLATAKVDGAAERAAALAAARVAAAAVVEAERRRDRGDWLAPRGQSALWHYRDALKAFPGYGPALAGMTALEDALLERAAAAAAKGEYDAADTALRGAARVGRNPSRVQDARADLAATRAQRATSALEGVREALARLDLPGAAARLAEAEAADPQADGLDDLAQRIAVARRYGHFQPGQRFADTLSDGQIGPAMVVVPHGAFTMGAGEGEPGARENEFPAHEVRFERGFALAVHETTVADFARFVAATGYRTVAERNGRSSSYDERGGSMVEIRGAHWRRSYLGRAAAAPEAPVVHIAHDDAVAYAEWLSARTGQRYRLPSEAEFEYALRGGATTPWPWGRAAGRAPANLTGEGDASPQGRRWGRAIPGWSDGHWGPAPVGTYPREPFGTFDLMGNVSEWVDDCWHDGYRRAPTDGRAWVNPGCDERVVRGGSWASTLEQARSAFRLQVPGNLTSARIGFRVARDL